MTDDNSESDTFETPDLGEVLEKNQPAKELGRPLVSKDVLRGFEDILTGRTAIVDDIGVVLK